MPQSRLITLSGFEQIPGAETYLGYSVKEMDRWWALVVREYAVPGYRMAFYCGMHLPDDDAEGPMIPEFTLDWSDDMLLFDYRTALRFKEDRQEMFPEETWGVVNFADLARCVIPGSNHPMRPGSVEVLSWPYTYKSGATFPCADNGDELG